MTNIGHNQPPPFEALADRVEALIATADKWIAERPKIEDPEQAAKCKDFIDQLRAEQKAADEMRQRQKKPFLEAGRKVDARFKPLSDRLGAALNAIRPKMNMWLFEQERLRQEAAKRATEEAEAARIRALNAAAQQTTGNTVQDMLNVSQAQDEYQEKLAEAQRLAKSRASEKGQFGGRAMSLRPHRTVIITDYKKALRFYAENDKVRDIIQQLANADVRAGKTVPGCEVKEEAKAV